MITQEIARDNWENFCDTFSQQHRGGAVTLEEFDLQSGAYVVTWDLALESIAADLKHGGTGTVSIIVNETPQRQVKHVVAAASTINLEQTDEGEPKALQIKSASGLTMALHVCPNGLSPDMQENMLEGIAL